MEKYIYTPYYCEENVYKLIETFLNQPKQDNQIVQLYAIFVTNPFKKTYIRWQKAGDKKNNYQVIWDYHVVFFRKVTNKNLNEKPSISIQTEVYDFDSTLGFKNTFEIYFDKALSQPKQPTYYRVVEGRQFYEQFASDRSHMIKKKLTSGQVIYQQPIPNYVNIKGSKAQSNMNLLDFIDCDNQNQNYGQWMDEVKLFDFFKQKSV